jgi:tetratricopeptide (TPR) repeat protein
MGDLGMVARVLLARAQAQSMTGQWPAVEQLAREAELSGREVGAQAQVALALGLFGIARREQGDLAGCRAAHEEEERVATATGDPGALAVARSNLAAVDIAENKYPEAIARMDQAVPVLRQQKSLTNLLPVLANRGQVHGVLGDTVKAIPDLCEGGKLALQLGNLPLAQQLLTNAIQLLYGAGRSAEAEDVWADLASTSRAQGDDAGLQRALGEKALLVLGRGDLDAAAALLDEQEAICRRTGDQVGLAACVGNRAILLQQRGDLNGALACLDEQLAVSRASNNGQGVLFATANRGEILGLLGRKPEARAALEEARTMATQWGVTAMLAQLDQMLAALG